MRLEVITRCLHQVIRPPPSNIIIDGVGVCYLCKYDTEKNKLCKRYYPIKFIIYDIKK
uniref:Uncharacterized protein n=1 Tax=viral metagenome TaxID=1070528 RepID=A0A6M3LQ98_9ZZZZ